MFVIIRVYMCVTIKLDYMFHLYTLNIQPRTVHELDKQHINRLIYSHPSKLLQRVQLLRFKRKYYFEGYIVEVWFSLGTETIQAYILLFIKSTLPCCLHVVHCTQLPRHLLLITLNSVVDFEFSFIRLFRTLPTVYIYIYLSNSMLQVSNPFIYNGDGEIKP